MITWAEANRRAAVLAGELHADLDVDLTQPIDVFKAVSDAGLVLAFSDLGNVSGLYLPSEGTPGILLHAGHPRTRQRYTAGHELGHHAFGHEADVDIDLNGALRRSTETQWPDHEKEAESFGAWFLMPRRLVRSAMRELSITEVKSPRDVYALSLWLGTSYAATCVHLGATRLISMPTSLQWAQIPPHQIKREVAGKFVPESLRNDVWWVTEKPERRSIESRPGDRLILSLDETPSSGFSWRLFNAPKSVSVEADSYIDEVFANDLLEPRAVAEAGGHLPRTIVLAVDVDAAALAGEVSMVLDQPWDPESIAGRLTIDLRVNPPLYGIQLAEADLRLAS